MHFFYIAAYTLFCHATTVQSCCHLQERAYPRFLSSSLAFAARTNVILWALTLFCEACVQETSRYLPCLFRLQLFSSQVCFNHVWMAGVRAYQFACGCLLYIPPRQGSTFLRRPKQQYVGGEEARNRGFLWSAVLRCSLRFVATCSIAGCA